MNFFLRAVALAAVVLASGCASVSGPNPEADPLQSFNRASFAFNDALDRAVLKPVAQGYETITPTFVRSGVTNAFSNVGDVKTAVNNLLQGKPGSALSDVGRVLVNTTLGILGLWDVATPMGLDKNDEDFGQTLGKWGVGSGPYLVLPLMGPGTVRDTLGGFADTPLGYAYHIDHIETRTGLFVTNLINTRANLFAAEKALDAAALDKYTFVRDAYLQRRLNQVHDGNVPPKAREALNDSLEAPIAPATPAK